MTTTVSDLVEKVRSMLFGSMPDRLNVLNSDYAPGGTINLRYPQREIQSGSLLTVGLNTCYVLAAGADGMQFTVIPSADGGPDVPVVAGSTVRVRPKVTTWQVFRELHDEIVNISSPKSGLFQPMSFESTPNWRDGMYPLPEAWWEDPYQPQKLIRTLYKVNGTGAWAPAFTADWMVERYAVRVYEQPTDAQRYEFTFAYPYRAPTSLEDNLVDLGLTEKTTQDIPTLGAAASLCMGLEGRRQQPFAQGDSRRPEEVPVTSSLSMAREYQKAQRDAIQAERTRLQALFSFQTRVGDIA